jgi:hypothetical protein
MEKKIVIKCGYMWQLICWILALFGHQYLHCWAPIAIKWIMRRKQMIQNFISLSHSNMDVNLFQYPLQHNAHSGELNASVYGHFSLQCVCLQKVHTKVTSYNSCQWPLTQSSNTLGLSLKWSWVWTFNFTFNLQFHPQLLGIL